MQTKLKFLTFQIFEAISTMTRTAKQITIKTHNNFKETFIFVQMRKKSFNVKKFNLLKMLV